MGGEQDIFSLDKFITYPIAKVIAPFLYNFGIKPNHVTISNIFFRIFILNKMINNNFNNLLYFLIFSHFLDTLDGTIARKYNLVSEFGKFIDQLSDKIFWGSTILLTLYNQIVLFSLLILSVILLCELKNDCFLNDSMEMNVLILILYYYNNYMECQN